MFVFFLCYYIRARRAFLGLYFFYKPLEKKEDKGKKKNNHMHKATTNKSKSL
jgi:hypothetical protein